MTRPEAEGATKSSARERIMLAAERLALERGPSHVSFEAVAREAGLSKGGVLYHFRTKAELLTALVERHIAQSRARLEASRQKLGDRPNAFASALVEAYRLERAEPKPPPGGVLVAMAENPEFLETLRHYHRETVAQLRRQSEDAEMALIAYLALEGLKFHRLAAIVDFDVACEDRVLARLVELLAESRSSDGPCRDAPQKRAG